MHSTAQLPVEIMIYKRQGGSNALSVLHYFLFLNLNFPIKQKINSRLSMSGIDLFTFLIQLTAESLNLNGHPAPVQHQCPLRQRVFLPAADKNCKWNLSKPSNRPSSSSRFHPPVRQSLCGSVRLTHCQRNCRPFCRLFGVHTSGYSFP